jgi:hypothetical protein
MHYTLSIDTAVQAVFQGVSPTRKGQMRIAERALPLCGRSNVNFDFGLVVHPRLLQRTGPAA